MGWVKWRSTRRDRPRTFVHPRKSGAAGGPTGASRRSVENALCALLQFLEFLSQHGLVGPGPGQYIGNLARGHFAMQDFQRGDGNPSFTSIVEHDMKVWRSVVLWVDPRSFISRRRHVAQASRLLCPSDQAHEANGTPALHRADNRPARTTDLRPSPCPYDVSHRQRHLPPHCFAERRQGVRVQRLSAGMFVAEGAAKAEVVGVDRREGGDVGQFERAG